MGDQVWPESEVVRSFVDDLERLFPQVIVLFNPVRAAWQAYEKPKGSDWDAGRLVNAIRAFHSAMDDDVRDWTWWENSLAPRIFEDFLPMRPGDWFIQYLRQSDFWRTGGAKMFMRDKEARERERSEQLARERHEYHRERAEEVRRPALDALPTGASVTDGLKELRRREGRAEARY